MEDPQIKEMRERDEREQIAAKASGTTPSLENKNWPNEKVWNELDRTGKRKLKRQLSKKGVQKLHQLNKQQLIKKAQEEGIVDKTAKIMSAIYLLHSHSAVLYDDLEGMLQKNGLQLGSLEYKGKKLNHAFNSYFEDFAKMIDKEQTINWANDLQNFGERFNKYAGLTPTETEEENI